jgi:hypothetical protein
MKTNNKDKMQHTKGNWHIQGSPKTDYAIYAGQSKLYAKRVCQLFTGIEDEEVKANARLIVTAVNNFHPLLEVLKGFIKWHTEHEQISFIDSIHLERAKQLLQKIESESNKQ